MKGSNLMGIFPQKTDSHGSLKDLQVAIKARLRGQIFIIDRYSLGKEDSA